MSKSERKAYLKAIKTRYRRANKLKKCTILDEFCAVCGYHRKYAIRLLNQPTRRTRSPRQPGRKPVYHDPALMQALKQIWFATDQMCSKKLVAAMPLWLPFYEVHYEPLSADIQRQLLSMSPATVDRYLKPVRTAAGKGRTGTKPGTLLRNQIPIRTHAWDVTEPGFLEADTVAHCGNSLAGDFVWSLTLTDYCTGWTECRATWNKGAHGVLEQIKDVENSLPFPVKGFDCDNGSEFLNYHLWRYFEHRDNVVQFTRSRPYKKNDNAHVEQKNWTHVRQLFGYDRFHDPRLVNLMNDLYCNEWSLYQNHFCPTMKLKDKTRINSKYRKRYEPPQTPYQRLMSSDAISKAHKKRLKASHQGLDPFTLKQTIEHKLKVIFQYVSVTSNVRQRI
ncbi:transposase [Porticoccus sp.]